MKIINNPVFIIGCARSGTTLLFQLLGTQKQLTTTTGYPDGEDHIGWIKYGKAIISGFGYPHVNEGHTGYHYCPYMDETSVTDEISHSMHKYYYEEVLGKDNSNRVLNKCPHLSNKMKFVQKIFPDVRFIHIIRDCLPVVTSLAEIMKVHHKQKFYLPDDAFPCFWVSPDIKNIPENIQINNQGYFTGANYDVLVEYWNKINTNISKQSARFSDQVLTIKYEELCEDPLPILNKVADFCGLPHFMEVPTDHWQRPVFTDLNQKAENYFTHDTAAKLLDKAEKVRKHFNYS